jgi:DNA-directed RNA polymerase specialized sigma24 family protein
LVRKTHKSDYPRALAIGEKALRSKEEAQDAVGEAFVRLITDRTRIEWFYRTLRDILVDRLRERDAEGQLFVSLDALMANSESGDGESAGEDCVAGQLPSRSSDCLDPMLVLMDRRKRRSKPLMVGQAKIHKKMRRARRGKWTDELENPRPERAPQTDR